MTRCAQRRRIGWLLMALASIPPGLWLVLGGAQAFADDSTSVPSQARVEPLAAASDLATSPGAGGQISVGLAGFHYELKAAAEAYAQLHPEVQVNFVEDSRGARRDFLASRVDVLGYYGDLFYHDDPSLRELREYGETHRAPPEELILAYWSYGVAVHRANPMKAITVAQIRQLFFNPEARWPNLGRSTDGRIRLYVYDSRLIAQALAASKRAPGSPPTFDSLSKEDRLLSSHAVSTHRARMAMSTDKAVFKTMADDEDGIMVWRHNKQLAASGLKILPIICTPGQPGALPADAAAVASGRYPLRLPLRVAMHPAAPGHVQAFVAWLQTPQAAQAMASAKIPRDNYPSPIAHVSMAKKDVPSENRPPEDLPIPDVKFEGPIQGAVAVLPTEPLSRYFLVGDSSYLALYERTIADAIQADGRLKLVDRTQLSRVLTERRIHLLDYAALPAKPIISADVIVASYVVSEGTQTYLRLCALHGSTGIPLGRLTCLMGSSPDLLTFKPVTFNPPLDERVRRWWPGVLARLHASRERPGWVVDAYAPSLELVDQADALRDALQGAIQVDDRVFAITAPVGDEARQEVLLRMLGLSASAGGNFTPAADYLMDARFLDATTVRLRLCNARLAVLASETVTTPDAEALTSAALGWLDRQVAEHAVKPTAASTGVVADDWARRQAREELEIARKVRNRVPGWRFDTSERVWNRVRSASSYEMPHADLAAARAASRRHFRRAAQLDPTLEEAAYELLPGLIIIKNLVYGRGENVQSLTALWSLERFLDTFPDSPYRADVLARLGILCTYYAKKMVLSPSVDDPAFRQALCRKGLRCYGEYMANPCRKGNRRKNASYHFYMKWEYYLYRLHVYTTLGPLPDEELQALVADWSRRFDDHLDWAPHSDFVRLVVFAHKKDQAGFRTLLTRMQRRWPDPGHLQWAETKETVRTMTSELWRIPAGAHSFALWCRGKRGIGDLPWAGYNPEVDELPCTERLFFVIAKAPKKASDAFYDISYKYVQLHPGVARGFNTFFSARGALKSQHILVIVGALPAEELPAIKELYSGDVPAKELLEIKDLYDGDLPVHRLGLFRDTPDSAPQEILIVAPPGRGKYVVLNDFLRFLHTPQGAEAMAKFGVTVYARSTATGKPPPNQSNQP